MKSSISVCVFVMLLSSSLVVGQDSKLFPNRLDPEGLSRSSSLVPPPILSDQSDQPEYRLAKKQEPQFWDSTVQAPTEFQAAAKEPQPTSRIIGEKYISQNTETHAVPLIRIETITPAETSTYIESTITVRVSNQGPTLAESVDLSVELSENVDVISTQPTNVAREKGKWFFKLGQLENGKETEVQITIKANREGEVTVRPRVSLAATSVAKIKAIKPSVQVRMLGNDEIIAGAGISRQIEVTNNGQEAIRNLQINSIASNNLISNIIFTGENQTIEWLAPGESRKFQFEAAAVAPGTSNITFSVKGDNIRTEFKNAMSIAQRTIQTQVNGPELTYKNSTGTYSIDIANEAPKDADNVEVILDLPAGMDIQVVDREARYNRAKTKLTWTIPRLRAGQSETIPFKAAMKSTGTHKLKVTAVSNKRILSDSHLNTHVVGRANINLQVIALADAVEIGSQSSIKVKIENNGSESASNVRLKIQLPESVRAVPGSAYQVQGTNLIIEPFTLAAGRAKTVEVKLVGATNGEFTIRATAGSDSTTNAISAEKNMFFFNGSKN